MNCECLLALHPDKQQISVVFAYAENMRYLLPYVIHWQKLVFGHFFRCQDGKGSKPFDGCISFIGVLFVI